MQMVRAAESTNNIDGIAINGVLAAVAFSDALTIAKLGLRSKGQDHQEVVTLISRIGTERSAKIASLVQRVIDRKQDVEYGDRQVGAADAQRIAGAVREIADLVVTELS